MTAAATPSGRIELALYVSGASPRSAAAIDVIAGLCETELAGEVDLEIIDVYDQPVLVVRDGIIATPTLVRHLPTPVRMVVGDLSDTVRLRAELDLRPVDPPPAAVDGPDDAVDGDTHPSASAHGT